MRKHFRKTILPIIKRQRYREFVEIGVAAGKTSIQLLKYCRKVGGKLTGIDPSPSFEPPKGLRPYWLLHRDLSLNVLGLLDLFDCVLIDGDHNWYTVRNELELISERIRPEGTIFLHDVAPPWARRDMYHVLERIPVEFRNPCREVDGVWIAEKEGGERNGVLTAVEDFVRDHPEWKLKIITTHHGLAILWREEGG